MAQQNMVTFTNNTTNVLFPNGQNFWVGRPLTAPARIAPGASGQTRQQSNDQGVFRFGTVYIDSESGLPTTRKFLAAFEIPAPQEHGPYGSSSARNYSMLLGPNQSIREFIVLHGFIVDAIGFVVADRNGSTSTQMFGGRSGTRSQVRLRNDEYITRITGSHGDYGPERNLTVIGILRIHTNLNPGGYGPYGRNQEVKRPRDFASPSTGRITGFFGRHSGNYIQSIGLFSRNIANSKAYAESGPNGPINWNMVWNKLAQSKPSHGFVDSVLGGKVLAAVTENGDATVVFSDTRGVNLSETEPELEPDTKGVNLTETEPEQESDTKGVSLTETEPEPESSETKISESPK